MNVAQKALGLLMLLALAVGGLNVTEATAAPRGPSKAHLRADANEVLYGTSSNYAKYKKKHPKALNWSNDGCSVPKAILLGSPALYAVLRAYGNVFDWACTYHDFGYRNFGSQSPTKPEPKLSTTVARRKSIDNRFSTLMDQTCRREFSNWVTRNACYGAADVFYGAVRVGGGSSFYK